MELWASGYGLVEGPRATPDGRLYFSDVLGGGVWCRAADGTIDVAIPKRRGVGGIALHADGGLVVSGRNVCHVVDGTTRVLYERDDVLGFNDLFTDAAGRVYVGSLCDDPFARASEPRPGNAYRIDGPGDAAELYGGIGLTNGIGFSPDGRRIYHADTAASEVIVHQLDETASVVGDGAVFAALDWGAPDGLAVDRDGGVWVAAVGGGRVVRFAADGSYDRHIDVPASSVTSLCFYGPELDELIIVTADNADDPDCRGSIFHLGRDEVGASGLPAPLARV